MSTRRTFIKQSGATVVSAMLGGSFLQACSKREQNSTIGLQLYTLREDLEKDPKSTLMKVANIGYGNVETFYNYEQNKGSGKFWGLKTAELKKILDDNNLRSDSGHYALPTFLTLGKGNDQELKEQADIAVNLGQHYLVVPVPPMHTGGNLSLADFQFMAEQLNRGGEYGKSLGLKIGYHNHFWEFRPLNAEGKTGYQILLEETEPDLVAFELDLFWAIKSGADPLQLFSTYPKRFEMWHVKDIDKSKQEVIIGPAQDTLDTGALLQNIKFAEVGSGAVDFKAIFKQADQAGLKHFFVEQDGIYMENHFESIRISYNYIKQNLI